VAAPPAVLVRDAGGNPVAGAAVHFEVVAGGGAVTGAAPTTDDTGVARVGSWTLGAGPGQELRATLADAPDVTVTFSATAELPARAGYDVTLRFVTPLSEAQLQAFESARRRIEAIVLDDVPDAPLDVPASAACGDVAVSELVDDLVVVVRVQPIDGVEGILGRAGPCYIRGTTPQLPLLALMEFDSADLDAMEATGRLEAVILHEMLHTLGFGTLWSAANHLHDAGSVDPFFSGPAALDAFLGFDDLASYGGTPVPVEDAGNPGTRDAHWRESVLGDELMTGWLSGGRQPLSRTTIASLGDLGYRVDLDAGEPLYSRTALRSTTVAPAVHLGEDVLRIPIGVVDARGAVAP
jgi:hypothetical protein